MNSSSLTPVYLGIDTGGTYTDGVLLDPQKQVVLKSVKVLTTHSNLTECIEKIIDQLTRDIPVQINLVALSTTLATNAIAEGKRKPVALFLLGYDPALVEKFKFSDQFATRRFFFLPGKHNLQGVEEQPLNPLAISGAIQQSQEDVDAYAVVSYAGPMNSNHEEKAGELIYESTHLPVVQAHHLSNDLDSIRRATTASLNASLLANTSEFLDAVTSMLARYQIHCPVMMVRGDGSVVQADYARRRPVEIVHSGPATSAIGGQFLSGKAHALVVDIGGTTTDLTLVENGRALIFNQAATVNGFRTCIRTVKSHSFGLGGDSHIEFDHWRHLTIGPRRVVPISRLCAEYPAVKEDFTQFLSEQPRLLFSDQMEYWILRHEPRRKISDPRVQQVIDLLRPGPLRLGNILKRIGVRSPILLDRDELVGQEIIDRAGLTPTDLLHVSGEFTPWDASIAHQVTGLVSQIWEESPEAFIDRIRRLIQLKISEEIVSFTSGKTLSQPEFLPKNNRLDRWLFEENLSPQNSYLECALSLKIPMVGIGAPAKAFLPLVAQALNAELIFPEHYAVANAVGTLVGQIVVRHEADILPCIEGASITGYYGRVGGSQKVFQSFSDAEDFARAQLLRLVQEDAVLAGAKNYTLDINEARAWDGMVHLTAYAIGNPSTSV